MKITYFASSDSPYIQYGPEGEFYIVSDNLSDKEIDKLVKKQVIKDLLYMFNSIGWTKEE